MVEIENYQFQVDYLSERIEDLYQLALGSPILILQKSVLILEERLLVLESTFYEISKMIEDHNESERQSAEIILEIGEAFSNSHDLLTEKEYSHYLMWISDQFAAIKIQKETAEKILSDLPLTKQNVPVTSAKIKRPSVIKPENVISPSVIKKFAKSAVNPSFKPENNNIGNINPCYCGSGIEYKYCHEPMDKQKNVSNKKNREPELVKLQTQIPGVTYYLGKPDKKGRFKDSDKSEIFNQVHYFQMHYTSGSSAEFEVVQNKIQQQELIHYEEQYLKPVCFVDKKNRTVTEIKTVKRGTLQLIGQFWIIDKQCVINLVNS